MKDLADAKLETLDREKAKNVTTNNFDNVDFIEPPYSKPDLKLKDLHTNRTDSSIHISNYTPDYFEYTN